MKAEPVVAKDVADAEFDRWVEAMDLEASLDPEGLDADDKAALAKAKNEVIANIMSGNLVVNDDGEFIYTPKKGDNSPVHFPEPTGDTFLAIDKAKKGQDIKKTFLLYGAWTGLPSQRFAAMAKRDLRVVESIVALFLG